MMNTNFNVIVEKQRTQRKAHRKMQKVEILIRQHHSCLYQTYSRSTCNKIFENETSHSELHVHHMLSCNNSGISQGQMYWKNLI